MTYELTDRGRSLTHLVKRLADWSLDHKSVIGQSRALYPQDHPDHDIR